jgi:drug/metabolite transporter (DMT)-like permease
VTSISYRATPHHDNLRGAASMVLAVGALALMDACLKVLAPHYSPMQVASMRGMSALPPVLVWIGMERGFGRLLKVRFPLHLLRGALGIMMLSAFSFALRRLPLSEAYTIFFVAPLLITLFAVLMLGEHVDRRRWLAIAAGFGGTLIVLRPTGSGALTLSGLAVLACAVGYALSAITVRVLSRTDSTQSMMFWLMLMTALGAGALAMPVWRAIQPGHWPVLAGIAVTGFVGQWAITEAFRRGQASFVAPFEYTALVWGVGLDWTFWRTLPAPITFAGAAVIISSGLYLVRRERVHVTAEPGAALRGAPFASSHCRTNTHPNDAPQTRHTTMSDRDYGRDDQLDPREDIEDSTQRGAGNDDQADGTDRIPARTDEIEPREERVGRADWNSSRRAGDEQPEGSFPEGQSDRRFDEDDLSNA